MPAKRLSMRKIKDVLRLCWGQGLSKRQTARSCGLSRPAVAAYLRRAEAAGLGWPLPVELDDGALERLLFPPSPAVPAVARGVPDWSEVHRELKRPVSAGVKLPITYAGLKFPSLWKVAGYCDLPNVTPLRILSVWFQTTEGAKVITWERVFMLHELHAQGVSISAIARQTGLDRKTVRRHLAAGIDTDGLRRHHRPRTPDGGLGTGLGPELPAVGLAGEAPADRGAGAGRHGGRPLRRGRGL